MSVTAVTLCELIFFASEKALTSLQIQLYDCKTTTGKLLSINLHILFTMTFRLFLGVKECIMNGVK